MSMSQAHREYATAARVYPTGEGRHPTYSTFPCDSHTYNTLKLRFSATLGAEREAEVPLV